MMKELALTKRGPVTLMIFDPSGRRVRRLIHGDVEVGSRSVEWDGRNDSGVSVPDGLYLVRMDAAGTRQTRRVMILR